MNTIIIMFRKYFLVCLYFSIANCSILIDSVAFLKDFINHSEPCSFLTFITCGDTDSKILIKDMKDQHKFLRFSETNNCSAFRTFGNIEMYVTDMQCASNVISWSNSCNFFARPFKWIFLYNQTSILDRDVNAYFRNISILIDSHVIVASLQDDSTIILKRIFKFREETELIERHIGSWDPLKRLKMNSSDVENGYNMRNFHNTVLKTCLVITQNDSLNHLTDKRDKHIDSIAKVNYVLIQHLKDFVNAELMYGVTSTWGYKNNNSKWSGMIGELTERRVDIGGTALFITVDRIAIIDYIAMTTKTRSKFVFREPKLSYVTNVFVLPFDWDVWISILGLLVIAGFVLLAIVKWEWKRNKYITMNETEVHMELRDSVADVIFLTFGALCQQATSVVPFSMPGRITTIFLFISLMFLYTSYSANIVALLQSSSKSIQTLDDLLKSRLEVGVDDTVFNHFYFPNATEPIRKAIYEKKVAPPGQIPKYFPILEGVKKMREGLFAFHMETGPGYKLVAELFDEGEKCGLQEIQYLQVPDPWLAIQKNSSFKEALKIGLFLIRESGLQIREIDAIYTKKPVCSNRGNSFISVGIVDCYAPTAVLLGGILLSLFLFILELNMNCINKRSVQNSRIIQLAMDKVDRISMQ